jgi:F0F1-type ATP synthase membrane subunit b/b'
LKKYLASGIQIDAMELLKSILAQLGVNHTFFMQFALVVVVYIFFSRFLFKPILAVLLIRTHKVEGLRRSADAMFFEHDKITKDYKSQWREHELKAREASDKIISEARVKAESIIDEAEERASEYLKSKRHDISVEAEKLSLELGGSSKEIEKLIKTRLFGE